MLYKDLKNLIEDNFWNGLCRPSPSERTVTIKYYYFLIVLISGNFLKGIEQI